MNLANRLKRAIALAVLTGLSFSTHAGISTTGSVSPTPVTDPFTTGTTMQIGESSFGRVDLNDGSEIFSNNVYLGQNSNGEGTVTISGNGTQWSNNNNFYIGHAGTGSLILSSNGLFESENLFMAGFSTSEGTVRSLFDTVINVNDEIRVGDSGNATFQAEGTEINAGVFSVAANYGSSALAEFKFSTTLTVDDNFYAGGNGNATVNILAVVQNQDGYISRYSFSQSVVNVEGGIAEWNNLGNLYIGGFSGDAELNIRTYATVNVGGTTYINPHSNVFIQSGDFNFNEISALDFSRVSIISGSLSGNITNDSHIDASTLHALSNPAVDSSGVSLTNNQTLFGHAILNTSLQNTATGRVEVAAAQRLGFTGFSNTNDGKINLYAGKVDFQRALDNNAEINLFGGQIHASDLINNQEGFIAGRGQISVTNSLINFGTMAFSGGYTDILGDVLQFDDGLIATSGNGVTTFYGDVTHDGAEIRTTRGSTTVFFGAVSGSGPFTGTGSVYFEGDLRPGNSPGRMKFQNDVYFGLNSQLSIELAGNGSAGTDYDVLDFTGDANLGGTLSIELLDDYLPTPGTKYKILTYLNRADDFLDIIAPNSPHGLYFELNFNDTSGSAILEALAHFTGDANLDGRVDLEDLAKLATNFGKIGNWFNGDFTDDGVVNLADLAKLATNFGMSLGSGASEPTALTAQSVAIPEPASFTFLLLGTLAILKRRK